MPDLTPSERRGALMLLALCALGAAWDLLHARAVPAPPVESLVPAASASAVPPAAGEPAARSAARPAGAALDLNRSTAAQLDGLPGIGPVLAARIVEHRRLAGAYRSADELLAVRGIGPHLLERLRPLVTTVSARGGTGADTMQTATHSRR